MRPLRIALVSQSYPPFHGGIAEHVAHLGEALRDRGHAITVITGGRKLGRNGGSADLARPPFEEPATPNPSGGPSIVSSNVHTNDPSHGRIRVCRIGRTLRIPSNGASVCITLSLPLIRNGNPLSREVFDLVHLHAPFEPILPLLTLFHKNAPLVATFHSAGHPHWAHRCFRPILRVLSARLEARIAVSQAAIDFVAPDVPGDYIIIPNGIDTRRFRSQPLPDPSEPLTLLFVGRLDPRKGIECLIDALPLIHREIQRPLRCWIVGDGPRRRSLTQRSKRSDVPIHFWGAVSRRDLPNFYRDAHMVISPALHGESFGVVLLEGLASGRPVIASDLPGYSEVLGTQQGSILFRTGSVPDLVRAVVKAAQSETMKRLSSEASRAAAPYDWMRVAAKVENVYRRVLGLSESTTPESSRDCARPAAEFISI
ncbi:MAG: glycosyltransferase family 4 protein [Candidatus Eisenbacteria bacterium]|uniref:Glycosyltransferase family 4 protein n=1 Tax=Eiseniibacteriota bacterium TaxID=2212470 RepID=A0A948RUC7_UNCEI|nr:glycosyltransferase family 4 protein [Candidatus Eisenbacteria bacterium]MBU1947317.1 glycosyltransferase family 4 protein [Candidatus Eisenbacteria bacterium]MBU2689627.1 glycosyltransferase family 4 protein [Candidatus Eisenbacteria bacterium]